MGLSTDYSTPLNAENIPFEKQEYSVEPEEIPESTTIEEEKFEDEASGSATPMEQDEGLESSEITPDFPNVEVVFFEDWTGMINLERVMRDYEMEFVDLDDAEERIRTRGIKRKPALLLINQRPTAEQFSALSHLANCSMTVQVVSSHGPVVEEDEASSIKLRRVYLNDSTSDREAFHTLQLVLDNPSIDILEVR